MWKDFIEKARQNAGFRAFQISEKIWKGCDFNPRPLCGGRPSTQLESFFIFQLFRCVFSIGFLAHQCAQTDLP